MPTSDSAAWSARFGLKPEELSPRVRLALTLLEDEIVQLQDALARAQCEAERDPLTNVLNRRGFLREVARAVAVLDRHASPAALLFVDLDGFKALNDQFGHATGDAALAHVARLLEAHVRIEDQVGRIGGDEFAVLLTHTDQLQADAKAASLGKLLAAAPFEHEGRAHTLTASLGVTALQLEETPEQALSRADEAMYAAKQAVKRRAALEALGAR